MLLRRTDVPGWEKEWKVVCRYFCVRKQSVLVCRKTKDFCIIMALMQNRGDACVEINLAPPTPVFARHLSNIDMRSATETPLLLASASRFNTIRSVVTLSERSVVGHGVSPQLTHVFFFFYMLCAPLHFNLRPNERTVIKC